LGKIAQNWSKLPENVKKWEIPQNWAQSSKIGQNRPKLNKIVQNWANLPEMPLFAIDFKHSNKNM
jgi:hypothetical protein